VWVGDLRSVLSSLRQRLHSVGSLVANPNIIRHRTALACTRERTTETAFAKADPNGQRGSPRKEIYMKLRLGASLFATAWIVFHGVALGQDGTTLDARDALLAALGRATLDCVATVEPSIYETRSGALERTFTACVSEDRTLLQRVDALLAVQFSKRGRVDDIAGHYVARWKAFTDSFPHGLIGQCPTWQLLDIGRRWS
jgi:hypothetical protein